MVTLIKNPNGRSPLNNPEVNLDGRNYVLGRMREEGMISSSELARLKALPLTSIRSRCAAAPPTFTSGSPKRSAARSARTRWHRGNSGFTPRSWRRPRTRRRSRLLESLAKAEARPGYRHQKYEDYEKAATSPRNIFRAPC